MRELDEQAQQLQELVGELPGDSDSGSDHAKDASDAEYKSASEHGSSDKNACDSESDKHDFGSDSDVDVSG